MELISNKIYSYDNHTSEDWKEFVNHLQNGHSCEITEDMYFYWLEVLPPLWLGVTQVRRAVEAEGHTALFEETRDYDYLFAQVEGEDFANIFGKKEQRYFFLGKTLLRYEKW